MPSIEQKYLFHKIEEILTILQQKSSNDFAIKLYKESGFIVSFRKETQGDKEYIRAKYLHKNNEKPIVECKIEKEGNEDPKLTATIDQGATLNPLDITLEILNLISIYNNFIKEKTGVDLKTQLSNETYSFTQLNKKLQEDGFYARLLQSNKVIENHILINNQSYHGQEFIPFWEFSDKDPKSAIKKYEELQKSGEKHEKLDFSSQESAAKSISRYIRSETRKNELRQKTGKEIDGTARTQPVYPQKKKGESTQDAQPFLARPVTMIGGGIDSFLHRRRTAGVGIIIEKKDPATIITHGSPTNAYSDDLKFTQENQRILALDNDFSTQYANGPERIKRQIEHNQSLQSSFISDNYGQNMQDHNELFGTYGEKSVIGILVMDFSQETAINALRLSVLYPNVPFARYSYNLKNFVQVLPKDLDEVIEIDSADPKNLQYVELKITESLKCLGKIRLEVSLAKGSFADTRKIKINFKKKDFTNEEDYKRFKIFCELIQKRFSKHISFEKNGNNRCLNIEFPIQSTNDPYIQNILLEFFDLLEIYKKENPTLDSLKLTNTLIQVENDKLCVNKEITKATAQNLGFHKIENPQEQLTKTAIRFRAPGIDDDLFAFMDPGFPTITTTTKEGKACNAFTPFLNKNYTLYTPGQEQTDFSALRELKERVRYDLGHYIIEPFPTEFYLDAENNLCINIDPIPPQNRNPEIKTKLYFSVAANLGIDINSETFFHKDCKTLYHIIKIHSSNLIMTHENNTIAIILESKEQRDAFITKFNGDKKDENGRTLFSIDQNNDQLLYLNKLKELDSPDPYNGRKKSISVTLTTGQENREIIYENLLLPQSHQVLLPAQQEQKQEDLERQQLRERELERQQEPEKSQNAKLLKDFCTKKIASDITGQNSFTSKTNFYCNLDLQGKKTGNVTEKNALTNMQNVLIAKVYNLDEQPQNSQITSESQFANLKGLVTTRTDIDRLSEESYEQGYDYIVKKGDVEKYLSNDENIAIYFTRNAIEKGLVFTNLEQKAKEETTQDSAALPQTYASEPKYDEKANEIAQSPGFRALPLFNESFKMPEPPKTASAKPKERRPLPKPKKPKRRPLPEPPHQR